MAIARGASLKPAWDVCESLARYPLGAFPRHEVIPRHVPAFGSLGPCPFHVLIFSAMNVEYGRTQVGMARRGSRHNSTWIESLTCHICASSCLLARHCMPASRSAPDCPDALAGLQCQAAGGAVQMRHQTRRH